ncbi:hypothetical protein GNI_080290 [Gregarina niphandrodes]|uniref:Uncharacterized protein n=1 Tax=Gregarina niphandrodes TaxID=110365 RepID=A0A023B6F4_GRENI|nr:hypothetical protein GNI_080290 [Gregarina niphandrodes]EZG66519.1 hypothetical protein GNI_080290 [Gregarina niphandrodes]|eukprot:XP_011130629.1 hypothetical protein GNI_080290 [Gregarina niphandrodes]
MSEQTAFCGSRSGDGGPSVVDTQAVQVTDQVFDASQGSGTVFDDDFELLLSMPERENWSNTGANSVLRESSGDGGPSVVDTQAVQVTDQAFDASQGFGTVFDDDFEMLLSMSLLAVPPLEHHVDAKENSMPPNSLSDVTQATDELSSDYPDRKDVSFGENSKFGWGP